MFASGFSVFSKSFDEPVFDSVLVARASCWLVALIVSHRIIFSCSFPLYCVRFSVLAPLIFETQSSFTYLVGP